MKNQRSEQLFDAIGTLPEDMIAAAAPTGRAKILRTRRLATAAACLVCACAVGFGAWSAGVFGADPEIGKNPYGEESVRAESGEPAPAPWRSWDSLPTGEQYTWLTHNGKTYESQTPLTAGAELGDPLGEITVYGYNAQAKEVVQMQATLHRLRGVSEQFAVAVAFPDTQGDKPETPQPYVYIDPFWQPETLGEMIDALNLEQFMSFGIVYDGQDSNIMYDVPSEDVWQIMLCDRDLVNVYDKGVLSEQLAHPLIRASVYIRALGYWNISLEVTDAGYLSTNIGSTGKAFYIGEDKAAEMIAALTSYERIETYNEQPSDPLEPDEQVYNDVEDESIPTEPGNEGATTGPYDPRA